jgi:hypothetical protein
VTVQAIAPILRRRLMLDKINRIASNLGVDAVIQAAGVEHLKKQRVIADEAEEAEGQEPEKPILDEEKKEWASAWDFSPGARERRIFLLESAVTPWKVPIPKNKRLDFGRLAAFTFLRTTCMTRARVSRKNSGSVVETVNTGARQCRKS